MYVRWQVGDEAPGFNPATNPKFAFPPDKSMKPPPVTKSFGIGFGVPHRMSLWACETMISSPVARVRCKAFTVMSDVPSCDPSICSLMTRVRTPGTDTIWFGAVPTTTSWPAARSSTISLRPETPWHVATDSDRTNSAVTSFCVPASRSTVATVESLRATESNPIVSDGKTSAFASDVSTWTKVASNSPPAEGRSPVSANDVSRTAVWIDTPVALPLYRVPESAAAARAVTMRPAHTTATEREAATRLQGEFVGFMIERSVRPSWVFPNLERMSLPRSHVVIVMLTGGP